MPVVLCSSSQVQQRSCEEDGGDGLSAAHCDCEALSLSGQLATASLQAGTIHLSYRKTDNQVNIPQWHLHLLYSLRPIPTTMAFTLSEIMAARRQQSQAQPHAQRGSGRTAVEVDEYSTNPTQAFTFYNINQGRFQPPHVHMWVDALYMQLIKGQFRCCLAHH